MSNSYAGLGGLPTGCVTFHGVVALQPVPTESFASTDQVTKVTHGSKLYLVYDRASEGTILPFLSRQFRTQPFLESWRTVIEALNTVANGLNDLHEHGVLHR